MKICIVGDITGNIDEGIKKITYNIALGLSKKHKVMVFHPLSIINPFHIYILKKFSPSVIHYIPGMSIYSLIISKILWMLTGSNVIVSVLMPKFDIFFKLFSRFFKPYLILAQSKYVEGYLNKMGLPTIFVPISGVDIDRFRPATLNTKFNLRRKYKIPISKFILLHIGHITKGRNLLALKGLVNKGVNVVVVGSTSTPIDISILRDIQDEFTIIREYLNNIEEVYRLSDCYIFPTVRSDSSIEIPLSVLEALACNLPLISTRFGGLEDILDEGDGILFIREFNEKLILEFLENIKKNPHLVNTRLKVIKHSWDNVVLKLEVLYSIIIT